MDSIPNRISIAVTRDSTALCLASRFQSSFPSSKSVFGNVVVIAFQIVFHVKIHANDVFLFLKNYF